MLNLILIIFISLIPILIWGYIFAYTDDSDLNRKRFFTGIFGGALSVIPILYMDKISTLLNFSYLNTFYFVYKINGLVSSLVFGFSLEIFLLFIVLFSFVFGFFMIHKFGRTLKIYLKNIFVFLFLVIIFSIFVYLIDLLSYIFIFMNNEMAEGISFGNMIFDSLKLIFFYYLIIAFIEESSKHFNFLQSSVLYIDSIKTGVLYAIFVALGFSLIENILYFNNIYNNSGFSLEAVKVYFFRSIFSVMVHVLCSSVIAYFFSKALLSYRNKDLSFPFLKIFLVGLLISVGLHLFFDLAISLGFNFVIILYFLGAYLYISAIFYREEKN